SWAGVPRNTASAAARAASGVVRRVVIASSVTSRTQARGPSSSGAGASSGTTARRTGAATSQKRLRPRVTNPASSSSTPSRERVDVDLVRARWAVEDGGEGVGGVDGRLVRLAAGPERARRRGVAEEDHGAHVGVGRGQGREELLDARGEPVEELGRRHDAEDL